MQAGQVGGPRGDHEAHELMLGWIRREPCTEKIVPHVMPARRSTSSAASIPWLQHRLPNAGSGIISVTLVS
jgi:hypothetical protein